MPEVDPKTVFLRLQFVIGATSHTMRLLGKEDGFMQQMEQDVDVDLIIEELMEGWDELDTQQLGHNSIFFYAFYLKFHIKIHFEWCKRLSTPQKLSLFFQLSSFKGPFFHVF